MGRSSALAPVQGSLSLLLFGLGELDAVEGRSKWGNGLRKRRLYSRRPQIEQPIDYQLLSGRTVALAPDQQVPVVLIHARLGACEAKATSTYLTTLDTGPFPGKVSKTSTALLAGVGSGVTVSSHWMVRFDYMRLEHITEESLNRSFNIDLITVGAAFVF